MYYVKISIHENELENIVIEKRHRKIKTFLKLNSISGMATVLPMICLKC